MAEPPTGVRMRNANDAATVLVVGASTLIAVASCPMCCADVRARVTC